MENLMKLGPKDMKGSIWDERGSSAIHQILISHQKNTINSIQFSFYVDDDRFYSAIYGEPTGLKFDTLELESESLVSISGEYDNDGMLASLTIRTSRRTYGPFGGSDHPDSRFEKFIYNFGSRSGFAGFHGSVYDSRVAAIGVYVKSLAAEGYQIWNELFF